MNNILNFFSVNDQRYEKKYVISSLNENKFYFCLKKHPLIFQKSYSDRFINNIYFDTPALDFYWDNVNGLSKRIKVRIRWYGNTYGLIKNPILEFKIKNNNLGKKFFIKLNNITIDYNLNIEKIYEEFNGLKISPLIKKYLLKLRMSLMNGYNRKYYISNNKKFRITYDYGLQFLLIKNYNNNFNNILKSSNRRIFEIKYDKIMDKDASNISNHFPFRITKSSKYVFGIDKLRI